MAIDSRNDFVYSPLDLVTTTGSSSGAAVPLASVAAAGASRRNICKRIQITMSTSSASVQVPITIALYDGASSTGTQLATWQLSPMTSSTATNTNGGYLCAVDYDRLHIRGALNTAMALSGPVGGAAGCLIGLNLQTYAFPIKPAAVTMVA